MRSRILTACAVLIGLVPTVAGAAPGDLDPDFGTSGFVAPPYGTTTLYASYADGRLLAFKAGADGQVLRIRRLTADGKPDATWGTAGEAVVDLASVPTALRPIFSSSSVVFGAGNADGSVTLTYDRLLLRLQPNGSLDRTFANAGYIDLARGPYDPVVSMLSPQTDGSTVIGLSCNTCDAYAIAESVVRIQPTGVYSRLNLPSYPNSTFPGTLYEAVGDWIVSMRRLADGRTLVAGALGVVRFNADGSVDGSYGGQGVVRIQKPTAALPGALHVGAMIAAATGMDISGAWSRSAVITPEGKVVMSVPGFITRTAADGAKYASFESVLLQLDANGQLDRSFGNAGTGLFQPDWATTLGQAPATLSGTFDITASPSGKLLLYGSGPGGPFLWRLGPDGRDPATGVLRGYQSVPKAGAVLQYRDTGDVVATLNSSGTFGNSGATLACFNASAPDSPGLLLAPDTTVSTTEAEASTAGGSSIVRVPVTRLGGSRGAVSVDYATTQGGTNPATAGSDYTPVSGRLSWANGETGTKYIDVSIIDDAIQETAEQFSVNLTGVGGGALLPASTILVAIGASDVPQATVTSGSSTGATGSNTTATAATGTSAAGGGGSVDPVSLLWLACAGLAALSTRRDRGATARRATSSSG